MRVDGIKTRRSNGGICGHGIIISNLFELTERIAIHYALFSASSRQLRLEI